MGRVAVIGSFNVDHVWHCDALPTSGATITGHYRTGPGGKGFNQAVAARRAGAETHFICALGGDAGGRLARELADSDGIVLHVQTTSEPTGTAGIYVNTDGQNTIVIGAGANAELTPSFVSRHASHLASADVVLAQLETPADAVLEGLRIARQAGATTILNPAPANAAVTRELLAATDILTPNETEFASLLRGCNEIELDEASVAGMPDDALHGLCRRLLAQGTVVVTLGAQGSFVSHAGHELRNDTSSFYRVAAHPANPIDTTGAGDAFNGAMAAVLASKPGSRFQTHTRFAALYAARSTERAGAAMSMPNSSELGQFIY